MMHEALAEQGKVHTLIVMRHGRFSLNERAKLRGEAALWAVAQGIDPDADATLDLLPEGRSQAKRAQGFLAPLAIDACLRSDTLRTLTTPEIALAGKIAPEDFVVVKELRERSRGIFSYEPDEWTKVHPLYWLNKHSTLDWLPYGVDFNGNQGETIRQVSDTRVGHCLDEADRAAPGGTVLLSTHAEWKVALRAKVLGLDDVRFRQPLVAEPGNIRALQVSGWVGNGQLDMYRRSAGPATNEAEWTHFRTVGTEIGSTFDTGWQVISR